MQVINFDEVLDRIIIQDTRYHREAYLFVREGLAFAQREINSTVKTDPNHVTGQQLLEALRQYGLSQYGPMAVAVLQEWVQQQQ